jgi:hypothetical protein
LEQLYQILQHQSKTLSWQLYDRRNEIIYRINHITTAALKQNYLIVIRFGG